MVEMSFHFVDATHNTERKKSERKLMRRHVMMGKNAGRKLNRRSKVVAQVASPSKWRLVDTGDEGLYNGVSGACHCDDSFSSIVAGLPVEFSREDVRVVNEFFALTADKLYPAQLGISIEDAKAMWFRVLFADEATYHCNMSLMQACNAIFRSSGSSLPSALHHLSHTFKQVQKLLDSGDEIALADSTIGIVAVLVLQEQIRLHNDAASVHFKGLELMVKLRGGLEVLEGNKALVLKLCKIDIVFALQHGGPTMFFRDHFPEVRAFLAFQRASLEHRLDEISMPTTKQMDPYLQSILTDIMSICVLFNNSDLRDKCPLDLDMFQEAIMSLLYRLLRFRSLKKTRKQFLIKNDAESVYHIGLIIFMMTTFLHHGGGHQWMVEFDLVSQCIRDILRPSRLQYEQVMLWFVIIGGIWIVEDDAASDRSLLTTRLRIETEQLNINTWDNARKIISTLPWIDVLHDGAGHKLWDDLLYGKFSLGIQ